MRKFILMVGLISALNACSGGSPSSKLASKSACELLTKEMAISILGSAVGEPDSNLFGNDSSARVSNCNYHTTDNQMRSVSLMVRAGADHEKAENAFDQYYASLQKTFGKEHQLEKISDVGTGGVWDKTFGQLSVFSGKDMIIVSVRDKTKPDPLVVAKDLANTIIAK